MSVDATLHRLVGGLDYPMFVVTAAVGDQRAGCLVGFATQCSIHPPRFLVCISRRNATYRVARDAGTIAVHFLTEAHHEIATLFGEQTGDDVDKFARCAWDAGQDGVPLLRDTAGHYVGVVRDRLDAGDHEALLVDAVAAVFHGGGTRQLGFQDVKDMDPGHDA